MGNAVFVFFLLFLVSTGSGLLVCCFISNFVTCFLWLNSFPGIILDICEQILFLPGFCVVNAVNDAITSVLATPSLLPFRGNKSMELYAVGEKNCVREMAVEVGSFSGHPGCYLVNLRVFPYNRYDAINSFLLSMLLAPPVGR